MEISKYVARRMLQEVCGITTNKDYRFEYGYNKLMDYLDDYTEFVGDKLFRAIPKRKENRFAALKDIVEIHKGILERLDDYHAMRTLQVLFVATFHMMSVYKDNPIIAGHIACRFELISHQSKSWNVLLENDRRGRQQMCILL